MSDDGVKRITPQSGLDLNLMLTDTMWGSPQVRAQIEVKLKSREERVKMLARLGKPKTEYDAGDKAAAWELLAFYTRDMRLANLNPLIGEVQYCQHYIDLAGDLLRDGYTEAFATSLARAATLLELSQSKNGFLRKRQNTLTQEHLQGELETKKKSLIFGGNKSNGG